MHQKYTKELLETLYKTKTIREIAEMYNTNEGYISKLFSKFKINKIKKSDRNKPTYEELYDIYIIKDYTYNKTVEYFKCPFNQLTIWLKEYNIIKKYENKKDIVQKNIIDIKNDYIDNKLTMDEIGKKYNISRQHLGNILKENNIKSFYSKSSIQEKIYNYFKEKNINVKSNVYLYGHQIDIYFPEKKIGIEFNGSYWHCELYKKRKYHYEKSYIYEKNNIFIYHIFGYEWDDIFLQDKIINQLNNLLSLNDTKIYARKCIIKEVNNQEKKQFLDTNHLQGNDKASIKLGLYYENELVSLMTFCKPRFNKKYEWELSRFCCKANCSVIGGASKLFKYFINGYKPKNIISYSDIAKTKGNLYSILGFKLEHIAEPNYVWWSNNKNIIKTRYECQKYKLLSKGYIGNSENEIMHNLKYYKIYDCGNKVWVWK